MNWTLVVATNSELVLQENLLRSEEVSSANEIIILHNPRSASAAYNEGLTKATGEVVVFAHQDVYLPAGWSNQLYESIHYLTRNDPDWGVAGVYGVTASGHGSGYVYSSGLRCFVGKPFNEPVHVSTLDELLLIIRKSSNLHFDERLPGFHLYGTDICLEAASRGMRIYVVPCFAFHNSCGVGWLPMDFWKAYMYLRKKWKERLPVATPCTRISSGCVQIIEDVMRRCLSKVRGKMKPGSRVTDPAHFYDENIAPVLNNRS